MTGWTEDLVPSLVCIGASLHPAELEPSGFCDFYSFLSEESPPACHLTQSQRSSRSGMFILPGFALCLEELLLHEHACSSLLITVHNGVPL